MDILAVLHPLLTSLLCLCPGFLRDLVFQSIINDIRRLEWITDSINKVSANLGLIRGIVEQLKTFSDLSMAFYEPYIAFKHLQVQVH